MMLRNRQLDPSRNSCSCPEGTPGSFPYEFQLETRNPHRCFGFHLSFVQEGLFPGTKPSGFFKNTHSRGLCPLPPTPRKRWSLHVPGDAQEARLNFGLRDRQLDPPRISCSFPEGTRGSFPYEFQLETPGPHRCLCVHLSFKRGRPFRGPKLVSKRVRSASLEAGKSRWGTMGEPAGAQKEK